MKDAPPICANKTNQGQFDIEHALNAYGDALLRLCFLYLKDSALAEDALQDTMIKAYRGYKNFKGGSSEKTWITRIAINVCKDYLRKRKFKFIDDENKVTEIPYFDNQEKKHDQEDIVAEIMKLPPKYKEVILLYYYQELKIPEISQILHIPTGTVTTRLKRAREQLRNHLKGWYYGE